MRENVRGTAFASKASLELPRKPILGWLVAAGCMKKSRKLRYCKQACISSFRLFFCAFHARDHAMRDRPADCLSGYALGGSPFFLREKRAGGNGDNAACGVIPQLAPQRIPRSFRRSETAKAAHKSIKRQSAEPCPASLRSKLKKDGEDQRIELARIPEILRPFSIRLPQLKTHPTNMHDGFFGTFLTQESTVPSPFLPLTISRKIAIISSCNTKTLTQISTCAPAASRRQCKSGTA